MTTATALTAELANEVLDERLSCRPNGLWEWRIEYVEPDEGDVGRLAVSMWVRDSRDERYFVDEYPPDALPDERAVSIEYDLRRKDTADLINDAVGLVAYAAVHETLEWTWLDGEAPAYDPHVRPSPTVYLERIEVGP